ncbi:TPA: class I SAM-dependent methyltransferase, partial [Clostridioides difficile]|nr:class I SAM-dependent methyltransferase [Clostridioides difficile]EGT4172076.1 class I SAM-dependent methyltransferase [Clostridioides difficile]EGT4541324.1 class I SAM-dependent methyltransferase [Clostridioides difficile]EGT4594080.1 class I SAM-dependent methyltransferase [Clostridioides difficile]EGT4695666.1 class I SAM-dependent methyltransferase [Clostridioides difficile]
MLTTVKRLYPNTSMYGIDISEEMLKKAKEKVLDTVTLSLGDAEHLPFENGKFDCLLCTDSFHHYPTPKRAIAEFCRVLDTNGYLILADFWKPFPIRQAMNIFIPFSNEGDVRIYSKSE